MKHIPIEVKRMKQEPRRLVAADRLQEVVTEGIVDPAREVVIAMRHSLEGEAIPELLWTAGFNIPRRVILFRCYMWFQSGQRWIEDNARGPMEIPEEATAMVWSFARCYLGAMASTSEPLPPDWILDPGIIGQLGAGASRPKDE